MTCSGKCRHGLFRATCSECGGEECPEMVGARFNAWILLWDAIGSLKANSYNITTLYDRVTRLDGDLAESEQALVTALSGNEELLSDMRVVHDQLAAERTAHAASVYEWRKRHESLGDKFDKLVESESNKALKKQLAAERTAREALRTERDDAIARTDRSDARVVELQYKLAAAERELDELRGDAGPCSICNRIFADCECTPDQKLKAWQDCARRERGRKGGQMSDGIPRRIRLDLMTPAELAITKAMHAVEDAGCSVQLTEAVILLGQARDKVADHVDGAKRGDG